MTDYHSLQSDNLAWSFERACLPSDHQIFAIWEVSPSLLSQCQISLIFGKLVSSTKRAWLSFLLSCPILGWCYSSDRTYRTMWALWWEMINCSRSYNVFKVGRAWPSSPPQIWTPLRRTFRNENGFTSEKGAVQKRDPQRIKFLSPSNIEAQVRGMEANQHQER
jgi:hypothetical protein